MNYETIIGLEVHAQLLTRSKMYCRCSADYASTPPNTHVCPVCLGMPGVLPVINRQAVEYTMMTALALNLVYSEIVQFRASAVIIAYSTACRFMTGKTPGIPRHTGQTWVLGGALA